MDIVQTFYNQLAGQYDLLYPDWAAASRAQAQMLHRMFAAYGFDTGARVLDCACGIGTQAVSLAALGYAVTASDISGSALAEAVDRADQSGVQIRFARADFRQLSDVFAETFDIVIAMDNALPHMLTAQDLRLAVGSITGQLRQNGILVASIRDYDLLLAERPPYSPPYICRNGGGQRVAFQTWDWHGDCYHLTQYIIEDAAALLVSKYECEYRAVRRAELSALLRDAGCGEVTWKMPEETGFFQPVVTARKTAAD